MAVGEARPASEPPLTLVAVLRWDSEPERTILPLRVECSCCGRSQRSGAVQSAVAHGRGEATQRERRTLVESQD